MSMHGRSKKETLEILAYVDGSLSGDLKTRFEERLNRSAELSQDVLNQKRIRAALRGLPKKTAPRNFMLSPDMIKLRKPKYRLAPAFSFASAGVTILLLAVFAGEFLLGNRPHATMMESAAAPEAAVYDEAVPSEPMVIFWDAAPAGFGGGGEEVMGLGGGAAAPVVESAILVPEQRKEPYIEKNSDAAVPSTIQESVEEQETVIFGLHVDEDESVLPESRFVQEMKTISIVGWVKIGLGTVALGLGITAIIIWIKKWHRAKLLQKS